MLWRSCVRASSFCPGMHLSVLGPFGTTRSVADRTRLSIQRLKSADPVLQRNLWVPRDLVCLFDDLGEAHRAPPRFTMRRKQRHVCWGRRTR